MSHFIGKMLRTCSAVTLLALGAAMVPDIAEARSVRGSTRTNVNRSSSVSRSTSVNRSSGSYNRSTSVNRSSSVNRSTSRDYNRDIDVDVDHGHYGHGRYGYGGYGYRGYHPVARGAAAVGVAAAATATAVAIGSMVYSLPESCSTVMMNGLTYQNCEGTWYQPQYSGTSVTYMVVEEP